MSREKTMKRKLLVIYGASAGHVPTTHYYVDAFRRHSRFDVHFLCIEDAPSRPVDLSRYDAVWLNYCARLIFPGLVPDALKESLAAYCGPKLVSVQDEYDDTNKLRDELRRIGPSVILTCVPQGSLAYVYPRSMFPGVRFESVLTGYISNDLLEIGGIRPLSERPIVIGYRGRDLSYRYGDLARQKAEIGLRVREACLRCGLPCDIEVDESSRIYGPAWFEFIKSCRVMLGSESGSNVFDFDGSVIDLYRKMKAEDPHLRYERFRPFIAKREEEINMGQISPRMFEAAATRTAMVLIRGRYSGLLKPHEHYIPLEPDYSNLDDTLEIIKDLPALEAMVERAYQDLVATDAYSYSAFVQRIDDILDQEMKERATPKAWAVVPELEPALVSRRPFGYDPFLLRQHNLLTTANSHIDRLLKEVKMYGEVIDQVGSERNRLLEENRRLIAENRLLLRASNLVIVLKSVSGLSRLTWLCRLIVRKLYNGWRGLMFRG
jgi:hypothetical protein